MNHTIIRALVAFIPISMLFSGAVILFARGKTAGSFLQLLGTASLVLVAFTHVCEAPHWFPSAQWGLEHSLATTLICQRQLLGVTFCVGYLLHAVARLRA
jgi:hypothetical protein